MMDIIKICALAIVAVCLILTLKQYKSALAVCLLIVTGIAILIQIIQPFTDIFDFIKELADKTDVPIDGIKLAIKALGIGYIVQFSSDICRDFGESALGSKLELCGKITILALSIPLFKQVLESVVGMLI